MREWNQRAESEWLDLSNLESANLGKDRLVRDASAGLGILTRDIGRLEHAVYYVSAGTTLGNQGRGE